MYSFCHLVNNKERDILTFEIEAKSGFDKLDANELKYLFAKKG